MKTTLRPQELYYLNKPVFSDPVEMLKYTFQGLCLDCHLEIYYKYIFINKNEKYKRKRLFLKLGSNYKVTNKYSKAETLLLSLFDKPELRLYEIKNSLMKEFGKKIRKYKYQYVYKDLLELRLCSLKVFLSSEARKEVKKLKHLIEEPDKNIDFLLNEDEKLSEKINELGANIIFLEDVTLKKLNKNINSLFDLNSFFEFDKSNFSGSYIGYGGLSYGGSFSEFGSGSSFEGFGGGFSGGGGSGGGW